MFKVLSEQHITISRWIHDKLLFTVQESCSPSTAKPSRFRCSWTPQFAELAIPQCCDRGVGLAKRSPLSGCGFPFKLVSWPCSHLRGPNNSSFQSDASYLPDDDVFIRAGARTPCPWQLFFLFLHVKATQRRALMTLLNTLPKVPVQSAMTIMTFEQSWCASSVGRLARCPLSCLPSVDLPIGLIDMLDARRNVACLLHLAGCIRPVLI